MAIALVPKPEAEFARPRSAGEHRAGMRAESKHVLPPKPPLILDIY